MADAVHPLLKSGVSELGLKLSEQQLLQLMDYILLVQRWNKAFNLTAVRDLEGMVVKHLLDSLALVPHISAKRLIDVGTGAGLPGIPLAIALPETQIALLDSNGKKTRFLFQVKTQLELSNISIIESRVELHRPAMPYDVVLSRAFASLVKMANSCQHLIGPQGILLAMKAAAVDDELAELDDRVQVLGCRELYVPYLGEQRALVSLNFS